MLQPQFEKLERDEDMVLRQKEAKSEIPCRVNYCSASVGSELARTFWQQNDSKPAHNGGVPIGIIPWEPSTFL